MTDDGENRCRSYQGSRSARVARRCSVNGHDLEQRFHCECNSIQSPWELRHSQQRWGRMREIRVAHLRGSESSVQRR
jgi:hypothetical protein